ncbi:MAG TPA: carbohydrate ABC transporter substrate-binding protein [Ruminiclostridium sp.]
MKRLICMILCVFMMATVVLSGCGKLTDTSNEPSTSTVSATSEVAVATDTTDGKKEFENKNLDIAVFEGGFGRTYWDAVVASFEKDYPGVKVNITSSPKIAETVKPLFLAGNPPDFYYTTEVSSYASDGALVDLTDVFESKALDKATPLKDVIADGFLDACKPLGDGKIFYGPSDEAIMGMWYNKTYFESKGWTAPKTWDEFFALGEKAKAEGKALFTYQGIYPSYNEMILYPSIASLGGLEPLKKIQTYAEGAWKDENVKKAMSVFYDMAQKGYLLKGTTGMNHTQAQTEFLKGNALFCPNGTWFAGEMKDVIPKEGFSFGFLPTPIFNSGDQQYAQAGTSYYLIPAKGKNTELAKEFLKYQYTDASAKLNAEKTQAITCIKGAVESAKPYIDSSIYEAFKAYDNGVKPIIMSWAAVATSSIKASDAIWNPLTAVSNKQSTIDQWSDKIEKDMTTLREDIAASK